MLLNPNVTHTAFFLISLEWTTLLTIIYWLTVSYRMFLWHVNYNFKVSKKRKKMSRGKNRKLPILAIGYPLLVKDQFVSPQPTDKCSQKIYRIILKVTKLDQKMLKIRQIGQKI